MYLDGFDAEDNEAPDSEADDDGTNQAEHMQSDIKPGPHLWALPTECVKKM